MKKIIALIVLIAIAIVGWSGTRVLTVAGLGLIPRSMAIKIAQGLAVVHGIAPVEIDHRNGRYRSAFEHITLDGDRQGAADSTAIAISEIGQRYLGINDTGSFGTLMGYSVAMGGDVDGRPGYEVVAGGYEYSDRFAERGMVLLLSVTRDPVRIYGPRQHRAWFGHSVANNGDFDGDGRADILVGARFANKRSGAAYLLTSGQLQGDIDSLEVDTAEGVIEFGSSRGEAELGFEVYFGDDWDGDGRAELVLRAHIDGVQSGGVYVVYSSIGHTRVVDLDKDEAVIQIAIGEDYADLGRTIATIGDLDGDGRDELLLGAQAASRYFAAEAYVPSRFYVVMSRSLAQQSDIGLAQMYLVAEGGQGEHLGACTGRLGDMDGDGVADFAVGARYAEKRRGALSIVSGAKLLSRAAPGQQIAIGDVVALKLVGEGVENVLGWSCAEVSADLDGDGIGEVVVGARGADGLVAGAGAVYVVSGKRIRADIDAGRGERVLGGTDALKIGGDRYGARLGSKRRFAAGGDFDGDGLADLAIGAPGWHEGGIYAGAVWVVAGANLQQLF